MEIKAGKKRRVMAIITPEKDGLWLRLTNHTPLTKKEARILASALLKLASK